MTPYKRIGHRISLLPVAQHCGLAPRLSEATGSNRSAVIGQAGHAFLAGSKDADALLATLLPKERAEVLAWKRPKDIIIAEGEQTVTLGYDDAEKEVPVGLDSLGFYVDPEAEETITAGTLDFAWVREINGRRVAYVCDIKRTAWATADDADTLQVLAYGFAYAQKMHCSAFVPGLWIASDPVTGGHYRWGNWHDMVTDGDAIWARIEAAALNLGTEAVVGPYCSTHCWARLHCKEFVLPAAAAESVLGPVAEGGDITEENAMKLFDFLDRYDAVSKAAWAQLEELIRRGAVTLHRDGKYFRPVRMPGRKSFDTEAARAELGKVAEKFVKYGKPFETFRWVKA